MSIGSSTPTGASDLARLHEGVRPLSVTELDADIVGETCPALSPDLIMYWICPSWPVMFFDVGQILSCWLWSVRKECILLSSAYTYLHV